MWTTIVAALAVLTSCLTIACLSIYIFPNLTTLKSFAEGLTFDNAFDQIKTSTGLIVAGLLLTILILILIGLSFCCCRGSKMGSIVLGCVILVLGLANICTLIVGFQVVGAGTLLCEGVSKQTGAISCGAVTWKLVFGILFGATAVSQTLFAVLRLLKAWRFDEGGDSSMSSMSHRRRTNRSMRAKFLAGYDRGRREADEEDLLEDKEAEYRDEIHSRGRSRSRAISTPGYYE
ncbi:hypothetical protein OIV83_001201 [Microbotryomycetes sp. JL201]|nr:hypothetical protein OIV83_001201 [Microbotryomycetes sp. JL201]